MDKREVLSKKKRIVQNIEIQTGPAPFDCSVIYHVVSDVFAFLLYMHQQIPSVLQDMTLEFAALNIEYKELENALTQEALNCVSRRKYTGRKRQIRMGIKRLEKLMNAVASLQNAFQLLISDVPDIRGVVLIIGPSPRRPQYMYEMHFDCGCNESQASADLAKKNKNAERFSRKVIRELISKGVGSASYPGPSKLFLLVKAPASFSMPQHFLPKRDFQCDKKVSTFKLWFKRRTISPEVNNCQFDTAAMHPPSLTDNAPHDLIWFQCRHIIKGLSYKNPCEEE